MKSETLKKALQNSFCVLAVAAALCSTGCQMSIGGQTLPSAYYQMDDIQYHIEGPEFKLQNEAQAMEAAKADQKNYRGF